MKKIGGCNQNGSALLMVLFMMTALILYSATIWHTTSYVAQNMHARIALEHQNRLLAAVLNWGVIFSQAYYQEIIKQQKPVKALVHLPLQKEKEYQTHVLLTPTQQAIRVEVELAVPDENAIKKSCVLTQKIANEKPVFVVA